MESVLKASILILLMAVSGLPLGAQAGSVRPSANENAAAATRIRTRKSRLAYRRKIVTVLYGPVVCPAATPLPEGFFQTSALPPELFFYGAKPPMPGRPSHQ